MRGEERRGEEAVMETAVNLGAAVESRAKAAGDGDGSECGDGEPVRVYYPEDPAGGLSAWPLALE